MATPRGCYVKELYRLCRNIDNLTCGQAKLDLSCEEDRAFYLCITPNDGYYKGATFKFKVSVPEAFPNTPPYVTCLNNVYHPNIDILGSEAPLCVSLLDNDWEAGLGLDWCVLAVLFLFHHPNLEDALSPVFGGIMDEDEFMMNVRASLLGGEVEGVVFDKLINESEETGSMISIGHPATAESENNAEPSNAATFECENNAESSNAATSECENNAESSNAATSECENNAESSNAATFECENNAESSNAATFESENNAESSNAATFECENNAESSNAATFESENNAESSNATTFECENNAETSNVAMSECENNAESSNAAMFEGETNSSKVINEDSLIEKVEPYVFEDMKNDSRVHTKRQEAITVKEIKTFSLRLFIVLSFQKYGTS